MRQAFPVYRSRNVRVFINFVAFASALLAICDMAIVFRIAMDMVEQSTCLGRQLPAGKDSLVAALTALSERGGSLQASELAEAIKSRLSILNVDCAQPDSADIRKLVILTIIWAVGAPAWFFVEYWWLFQNWAAVAKKQAFDHFKHNQQIAAAIWAGVLVVNGVVLSALF